MPRLRPTTHASSCLSSARRPIQPDARDAHTVRIERPGGHHLVHCAPPAEFDPTPDRRVFNLVPGFECAPLSIPLPAGRTVHVTIQVERG